MNSTIINIIIGVVSSTLFALLVWLFKNHLRRLWFSTLGIKNLYNKLGVVKIFQRRTDAIEYLIPELLGSKEINIIQYKGYTLIDSYNRSDTTLYKLATNEKSVINKIKFLLLNPQNKTYISQRMKEIFENTNSQYLDLNQEDIFRSIQIIKSMNTAQLNLKCEFAFFNESLKWNLLISKNYVLIGFYLPKVTAIKSITLLVTKESILGYSFNKYFEDIWKNHSVSQKEILRGI